MKYIKAIFRICHDIYTKLIYRELSIAFSVETHLTISEQVKLYKLSKTSKFIAEIGSYIGASACCFGTAARDNSEKKIICIDTWNNDAMSEGNRDTWSEFKTNTSSFNKNILPVRGFSTDVVEKVRMISPTLDLLFIDGDHSYEGVKADWEAYKAFLRPGAIVVFHDYGWAEGVKRVIHEDVIPLTESHEHLPNMWWCTLAKKP